MKPSESGAPSPSRQHVGTTLRRRYNVDGYPDTQGPFWNPTTVRPAAVELIVYGTPEIQPADADRVGQITITGRTVQAGGRFGPAEAICFFSLQTRTDMAPRWVVELLEAEGYRYGR